MRSTVQTLQPGDLCFRSSIPAVPATLLKPQMFCCRQCGYCDVWSSRRALFHCNYCNKDISNTIRVKCAVCPDFDLCLECFSVGVEVHPHKRSHAYRVVDNLSFPLFAPDWGVRLSTLLFV